jgi:autotransporter-associated beta strand protein
MVAPRSGRLPKPACLTLLPAILLLASAIAASGATHTWNGAAGNLWSLSSSWTGGAPSAGEANVVLQFPAGAASRSMVNDLPGLTIQSIAIADSYQVTGQAITLSGGLTASAGSSGWGTAITLSAPQTWVLAGDLAVLQALHGSGDLAKGGNGALRLQGSSDFTGGVDLLQGNLYATSAASLGTADGGTRVRNGASLWAASPAAVPEPVTLDAGAALRGVGGISLWSGPVDLAGDALLSFTRASVGDARLVLSGPISGSGGFTLEFGEGPVVLASSSNTYSGPVAVLAGSLELQHPQDGLPDVTLRRGTGPVQAGGALLGYASFGSLTAMDASRIDPGGTGAGGFGINGDLVLRAPARLALQLFGAASSAQNDRIDVAGTVDLTGGILDLTVGAGLESQPGETFLLIANFPTTGTPDPVVGTFQNLPEGSVLGQAGYTFRLSYQGGEDGNDVTLTTLSAPGRKLYTVPPCRLYDSRDDGAAPLPAVFRIAVAAYGRCAIPPTARALSASVTVVQPQAAGYLSFYPGDQGDLGTSTINFSSGQIRANNAVFRLASDGSGRLGVQSHSVAPLHLLIDVNGYFE